MTPPKKPSDLWKHNKYVELEIPPGLGAAIHHGINIDKNPHPEWTPSSILDSSPSTHES